jgi:hypothetical protein
MSKDIDNWQPRVMRHHQGNEGELYAIHEVYFGKDNTVVTYTEDTLTPKKGSVSELKDFLLSSLNQEKEEFEMGDSRYIYSKEDIELWLNYIDELPINYENE